jgi:hypothetical protein
VREGQARRVEDVVRLGDHAQVLLLNIQVDLLGISKSDLIRPPFGFSPDHSFKHCFQRIKVLCNRYASVFLGQASLLHEPLFNLECQT